MIDFKEYVRDRKPTDKIKIGLIELYSNGKEDVIMPFPMSAHPTYQPYTDHADNTSKIIKSYIPNAEIHLVFNSFQGIKYLMDNDIKLVNISLGGMALNSNYALAEKSFLVIAAGNDGDEGENGMASIEKACAVGAVNSSFIPQSYSSFGKGYVKTCAVTGLDIYTGKVLHGTSFAAPVVTALIGQWYIWYFNQFGVYPTIAQSNDFVIKNSHDIFEDDWDLKTGYGIMRLPKQFNHKAIKLQQNNNVGKIVKIKENEPNTEEDINLMVTPFAINGRTVVGASDIGDAFGIGRSWEQSTQNAIYVK